MVGVVGGEPEQEPAPLERLVPLRGRIAASELELAARVPDLEPEEARARLELLGAYTAPARVGDVGDAAVLEDPGDRLLSGSRTRPPG